MNAAETDQLRADILRLDADGLKPGAIARQLRCARSTVYKVLGAPGPDGRHAPGPSAAALPEPTLAAIRRLAADDRQHGAPAVHAILLESIATGELPAPAPAVSTIARLLRAFRAEEPCPAGSANATALADPAAGLAASDPAVSPAPPAPRGPPPRPLLPDYERAAAGRRHYMLLEPEAALLQSLVREAVAELDRPGGDPRVRGRQREHVANLVLTLMRASRLAADASGYVPRSILDPARARAEQREIEALLSMLS